MTKVKKNVGKEIILFGRPLYLVFFFFSFSFSLFSQTILRGRVVDSKNQGPIFGASVIVKSTTNGIATDLNGEFKLEIRKELPVTLLVSLIGYKSEEIEIYDAGEPLEIALSENANLLDAVVVVGYGTQKRREITGSVTSIGQESFNKGAITSVDQLISGRAAGVQITQSSSEPGGGVSIRIRGANSINANNEPLYVIDGFPIDNSPVLSSSSTVSEPARRNPLNSLNPGDIESVEILKDASATAIYGSRGANGVILITTKKGSAGKLKVSYNTYFSTQNVAKKIPMLSAKQYMSLLNDLQTEEGATPEFTQEQIETIGEGVNWQDEIFRTGNVQNHQLSFSGGQNNLNYYVSLNYFDQDGIVISSGLKRYNGQVNLGYKDEKFKLNVNINSARIEDNFVPNGVSINENAGILNSAIFQDPTLAIYESDGKTYAQSSVVNLENPLGLAYGIDDVGETNRTFANIKGEYTLFPELILGINLGSDTQNAQRDTYISKNTKRGASAGGVAKVVSNYAKNYLLELTATFNKDFRNHHVDALAGYTYQEFEGNYLSAGSSSYSTDAFLTYNLSAGTQSTYTVGSSRNKNQLLSYLGRVNYSFLNRYFLTATLRSDGSSRFGEKNKYGYFPSLSVGWELKKESFLENVSQLSSLKIRSSYGHTGNQEIGNYRSLVLLGTQGQAIFDGVAQVGITTNQLANPNLKWETTKQFDLGIDFSLFTDRISGSVDYFKKKTTDLLLELPVPNTTGFSSTLANVGSTSNWGFDLIINTLNLDGKLKWRSSFNLSTVRNKVGSLASVPYVLQGSAGFFNGFTILKPGEALNSYYGYDIIGILQEGETYAPQPLSKPGEYKYRDADGDGSITTADMTILGNPFPDFTFGVNNEFTFGKFTLSFFLQGSQGGELLNLNISESENPISFRRNRLARSYTDRWTASNPTNNNNSGHTPANPYVSLSSTINSRAVQDASFIRLKSAQLSYDFTLASRIKAQLYISGQNLFTITDYFGFDPDVSSYGSSNIRADYNAYPLSRIYTVGFNLNF